MATPAQMERLIGKALMDAEFREQLLADPEKAARSLRYRLTDMQVASIRRLSADEAALLAAAFEKALDRDNARTRPIGFW